MTNGDVLAAGARPEAYSERIMFFPLLSRCGQKVSEKIWHSVRTMDQSGVILLTENDWQPARLPYNV
jgi:hypothetical protein